MLILYSLRAANSALYIEQLLLKTYFYVTSTVTSEVNLIHKRETTPIIVRSTGSHAISFSNGSEILSTSDSGYDMFVRNSVLVSMVLSVALKSRNIATLDWLDNRTVMYEQRSDSLPIAI